MTHGNKRRIQFPFFPLIMIAGALLLGLIVMLLWNAIVPSVFNAGTLNYWQAVGLLVLCRILLGGFRGRPGGYYPKERWKGSPFWRHKWMHMSEEEKAKFKEQMKRRFNPPDEK